ncbi:LOW QUALITY PROTEIN: zinc transporter ZIP9-like [Glossophaga mutica]
MSEHHHPAHAQLIHHGGLSLLCGTAPPVIVPEGVHTLYEDILEGKHHQGSEAHNVIASGKAAEIPVAHEREHNHDIQLHAYTGVPLVLGFVFMLLEDEICNSYVHYTDDAKNAMPSNSKITTTLGLAIHAAGDGIALGAAASTSQTSVQLIVFVASVLCKSPVAFGLVLFLMNGGLERNQIRKHLLVFALAAPVMSMVTFLGLNKGSKEAFSEVNATGLAKLLAARTFLYVAPVYVLPDMGGMRHSHQSEPTGDKPRTFHLFSEGLLGSPRGFNTESLEYAATRLLATQQRRALQSLPSGILESSTEAKKVRPKAEVWRGLELE